MARALQIPLAVLFMLGVVPAYAAPQVRVRSAAPKRPAATPGPKLVSLELRPRNSQFSGPGA